MPIELNTVLYPVKDVDQAKATFTALFGVEPHVDSKYYVGYEVDGHEIGLVPNGHDQGMAGPEAYFDVEDINASLAALKLSLIHIFYGIENGVEFDGHENLLLSRFATFVGQYK